MSSGCSSKYILKFLQGSLTTSAKEYEDLMSGGYDSKFTTYADAMANNAAKIVDSFIKDNGNKYFSCLITEPTLCKSSMQYTT
jgi:hypothetical protein